MDETKALSIVSALANGVNPQTGEVFAPDSPYQTADVVRALFLAAQVLESRPRAKTKAAVPDNAGKPWGSEEDERLLKAFDAGTLIPELARAHARTPAGIQARLEKHGRLQPGPQSSARRYAENGRSRSAAG